MSCVWQTVVCRIYEINPSFERFVVYVTPTLVGFDKIILPVKTGVTKIGEKYHEKNIINSIISRRVE
jgi:voltage-gated potassium channel Kch